jgi:hypothetical protein
MKTGPVLLSIMKFGTRCNRLSPIGRELRAIDEDGTKTLPSHNAIQCNEPLEKRGKKMNGLKHASGVVGSRLWIQQSIILISCID